jgi:AcrR family transcriptional regulator
MKAESLRKKHADRTRQAIAEAGIALFRERGFNATTIEDIAQRADVSPRTFFRYFPRKESLLLEGSEAKLSTIRARIAARQVSESPEECLVAVLREIVAELAADREWVEFISQLASEHPELLANHKRAMMNQITATFVTSLSERFGWSPVDHLRLRSMTAAMVACVSTTIQAWLEEGATGRLQTHVEDAFEACRRAFEVTGSK